MKTTIIIVAGGIGKRMDAPIPKQFIEVKGKAILCYTLEKFYNFNHDLQIVLVLHPEYHDYWKNYCLAKKFNIPHVLVEGGETRFQSVKNGLKYVEAAALIAVHDAVRPLVSNETIANVINTASNKGNAIPYIPLNDSIRWVEENGNKPIDRNKLVAIQTPQCFQAAILQKAYQQPEKAAFTDDASVVENLGEKIYLVQGNPENIKITQPIDLLWMEKYLDLN